MPKRLNGLDFWTVLPFVMRTNVSFVARVNANNHNSNSKPRHINNSNSRQL